MAGLKLRFFLLILLVVLMGVTTAFGSENKIVAYYFYGSARCATCHNIENYSKEAIKKNFPDELSSGKLVFKPINVEDKGNEHFIQDYQLYTKALVLSHVKEGKEIRYKNLTKIWEYIGNKNKFEEYVVAEIKEYLKE